MRVDPERLHELRGVLRTALVSDALDALGRRRQCLGWDIAPLDRGRVLIGHAFNVSLAAVDTVPEVPYVGLLKALDAIGEDDIVVLPTVRAEEAAVWGELLSTACRAAGAVGAVTDGLVRDVDLVRRHGFPVFARGTVPYDINGRFEVTGHGDAAEIDGVAVEPGVLIVADADGVVVVPEDVRDEVLERAVQKRKDEDVFRRAVANGMRPSEAYERFRVL